MARSITDYFQHVAPKENSENNKKDHQKDDGTGDDIQKRKAEAMKKLSKKALFKLEYDNVCPSWMLAVFQTEMEKPYFWELKKFLDKEAGQHKIFPPLSQIYSWTTHCSFSDVRVVILGQDPYHNEGQAHGLAFSIPPTHSPLPPSLFNIYKELSADYPDSFVKPSHGDLSGWARQGVLLLNATLTVRAHLPGSHAKCGWEQFTDAVISGLSKQSEHPLVFMLWGAHAQKKGAIVDSSRHLVLQSVHPSPLSASRGFFGCRHFSKCNAFLTKNGMKEIDWSAL